MAKYQGRTVKLNKIQRGDVKKFKVFVRDSSTGNIKKVNFGDKTMRIKKNIPARKRSFMARMGGVLKKVKGQTINNIFSNVTKTGNENENEILLAKCKIILDDNSNSTIFSLMLSIAILIMSAAVP